MKPKLSFIIATKNRDFLIKDTINSLLNQVDKNWEAIIIDDHGQDETEKIIRSFSDERLRYFRLLDAHGHGVCCARNFGTLQARADLVAILDSDDLAYPNRVTLTLDAFKNTPDADFFYGNLDVWEEETGIVRDRKTPFSPYSLERMKEMHYISQATVAMKRKVLLENPYNSFFRIAEDYELFSRIAILGKKFIFTDQKITKYRVGKNNASVGENKVEITKKYGLLVRMVRGWIPFDGRLLGEIEEMEKPK